MVGGSALLVERVAPSVFVLLLLLLLLVVVGVILAGRLVLLILIFLILFLIFLFLFLVLVVFVFLILLSLAGLLFVDVLLPAREQRGPLRRDGQPFVQQLRAGLLMLERQRQDRSCHITRHLGPVAPE